MRRKLVIGNWKMHGSNLLVQELLGSLKVGLDEAGNVEVGVCPTTLHLAAASETLIGSQIKLGAQNANAHTSGAFTGEVAAEMLPEYGVSYCLVGHSERRELFLEDDTQVAEKFASLQKAGLTPVLCVGESLDQREQESTEQVILAQVEAVLDKVGVQAFVNAVIAYEPIWAIGTGMVPSLTQITEVHDALRALLVKTYGAQGEDISILYGGSVKPYNAPDIFSLLNVNGALVGGASLKALDFIPIMQALSDS